MSNTLNNRNRRTKYGSERGAETWAQAAAREGHNSIENTHPNKCLKGQNNHTPRWGEIAILPP